MSDLDQGERIRHTEEEEEQNQSQPVATLWLSVGIEQNIILWV